MDPITAGFDCTKMLLTLLNQPECAQLRIALANELTILTKWITAALPTPPTAPPPVPQPAPGAPTK